MPDIPTGRTETLATGVAPALAHHGASLRPDAQTLRAPPRQAAGAA